MPLPAARHRVPRTCPRPDSRPRLAAPEGRVPGEGELVALASVEQLGERVLEQRQRVRLAAHVADQLGEQARLEPHADPLGRLRRGGLELARPERQHVHDVLGHEPAEDRIGQRAIEEVGAQHDEHPQAVAWFLGRGHETGEEPVSDVVVDEREELLELVDHD